MGKETTLSTTFKLDKTLLTECFEQSMTNPLCLASYRKAIVFIIIGMMLLMFSDINGYVASFVVGLGIVEALSVRYQRAWWVTRQLLGRSGNNNVTVIFDETAIQINSEYVSQTINWQDVEAIQQTELGYLIISQGQKHYLSNRVLSASIEQLITEQAQEINQRCAKEESA